jgi:hypothetical protein
MELPVDLTQRTKSVGVPESSQVWVLQPITVTDRPFVAPDTRPYSYLADCECPDDCLRDHGNE